MNRIVFHKNLWYSLMLKSAKENVILWLTKLNLIFFNFFNALMNIELNKKAQIKYVKYM